MQVTVTNVKCYGDADDCNKRNVTTRQNFVQSKMKLVAEQYEKNSDS